MCLDSLSTKSTFLALLARQNTALTMTSKPQMCQSCTIRGETTILMILHLLHVYIRALLLQRRLLLLHSVDRHL